MWVSTGKEGCPNACAMTTLAVLCPTPASTSSSSNDPGTCPWCFSISMFAVLARLAAFVLASPISLMISWIAVGCSFAMDAASGATLNSLGVT